MQLAYSISKSYAVVHKSANTMYTKCVFCLARNKVQFSDTKGIDIPFVSKSH